uniref:Multifunctional fusion protein n=1 Tax=Steinernema glaseri TaxID=37863 RepID=A0A1I7YEN0_9BILA
MSSLQMFSKSLLQRSNAQAFRTTSTFTGLTSEQFLKKPINEPILEYKKGSSERAALEKALSEYSKGPIDVPLRIGTEKIVNNLERRQVMPFEHKSAVARYTYATNEQIKQAIDVALEAREAWEKTPLKDRAEILLKAADLCAGKYRMALNAATMLGQGKNIIQAEIDSACELIDFFRFNSYFALGLEKYEPISTKISTNKMIYRGMEGFVAAIAPFNFTAIGGNLASAPALMGNVVLWKPSDTAVLSNYIIYQILEEAGMPPGVISYLPSDGPVFGNAITSSKHLAAINFTGSVPTFKYLWKKVAENIDDYVSFPKLVGECGGKNFHFVHKSADLDTVAAGTVRSSFEYQGQKCSACSRMFVADSVWPELKNKIGNLHKQIKMGDARDGSVFMSAVIDDKAFARIKRYIDYAKSGADGAQIVFGGKCDDSKGYFVEPTVITVTKPDSKLLTEEIFGPVVTVYVYPDGDTDKMIHSLKNATPFGLTGAVYSQDKNFLYKAKDILRDAVGNLYLNDKSTGSVVGQQPFGGARMSGTNDKAGGPHYTLKWASPQTIKETSVPQQEWRYPSMD